MKKIAIVFAIACATACGSSNSSSAPAAPSQPPAPTKAAYTLSASPNPVVAGPDPLGFPFIASFTATVTETAGVSGNVDTLIVSLYEGALSGANLKFSIGFNPSDIKNRTGGTNHVDAKGALNIPVSLHYSLTGSGRQATIVVGMILVDDFGNRINIPNVVLNVV